MAELGPESDALHAAIAAEAEGAGIRVVTVAAAAYGIAGLDAVASVEEALARKGFRKAGAGESPDFLVAYFALISVNTSGQTLGQFLPGTVSWGLPPFDAVATSLKIYEQGSLVLDVMTPTSKPMWRGVARAEVHRDRPDAERSKLQQGGVTLPPVEVVEYGLFYRLYSGPFATRAEASAAASSLQEGGAFKPLVVQR